VTYCDALTCDYVLTYRVSAGDIAHFEMSANAGWAAVGFSSDEFMVQQTRRRLYGYVTSWSKRVVIWWVDAWTE